MRSKYSRGVLFALIALMLTTSCREVMKLKSSVRKTQSQVRSFDKAVLKMKKGMGVKGGDEGETESDSIESVSSKQKNLLNEYGYLYDFLNGKDTSIKSGNFSWDSIQNVYYVNDKKFRTIQPDKEVFGWHPYWMGSKWENYPFELLSTISYFSYKLDSSTGGFTNPSQIEDWKQTSMIDSAQVKDTRVLLTVSCHGSKNVSEFLDNKNSWDGLIKTVGDLVLSKNGDGIDLNFENLPYFKREKFNQFVKYFNEELTNQFANFDLKKEFFLSLTLPAINSRDIYDVIELQKHIDLFVIMGYDYHVGTQDQGAVAPLRSSEGTGNSLSNTLGYYLGQGIDPQKTVLAFPYYGSLWSGKIQRDGANYFTTTTLDKPLTYSEIKNNYIDNSDLKINAILDEYSMTNYYNITFDDNSTQELWFDDDYTLSRKYDYALAKNLKGIGIWALGYDNGTNDLWDVIENKFSTDQKIIADPIAKTEGYPIRFSSFILKHKTLLLVVALFFVMTVILAFLILLSDWNVRDSIIRNQLNFLIFILIIFIILIPITFVLFDLSNKLLSNFNLFLKSEWKYYLAYFIGILTMAIAYKIRIKPTIRP